MGLQQQGENTNEESEGNEYLNSQMMSTFQKSKKQTKNADYDEDELLEEKDPEEDEQENDYNKQQNQVHKQEEDEYIQFQYYNSQYSQILKEIQNLQNEKVLEKMQEDEVRQIINRIAVLVFDYDKLSDSNSESFYRDTLLQGMVHLMLISKSIKIKSRIIKQGLAIIKSLGISYIFGENNLSSNNKSSKFLLSQGELLDCCTLLLNETKEIAEKAEDYEELIINDGIISGLIDFLKSFERYLGLYIKQFDLENTNNIKKIEILDTVYEVMSSFAQIPLLRSKMLEKRENLELFSYFLHLFPFNQENTDKEYQKKTQKIIQLYQQITLLFRALIIDISKNVKMFVESKCIMAITKTIELYSPEHYELIQNAMRILTKVSLEETLATQIYQNSKCIENFVQYLNAKHFQTDLFIILRVVFVLENLERFIKDLTIILYFEFNIFPDLCECYMYFSNSIKFDYEQENSNKKISLQRGNSLKKNNNNQMMQTFQNFNPQKNFHIETNESIEVVIKILKLIYNCISNDISCANIYKLKQDDLNHFLYSSKLMLKQAQSKNLPHNLIIESLKPIAQLSKIEQFLSNIKEISLEDLLVQYIKVYKNDTIRFYSLQIIVNLMTQNPELRHVFDKYKQTKEKDDLQKEIKENQQQQQQEIENQEQKKPLEITKKKPIIKLHQRKNSKINVDKQIVNGNQEFDKKSCTTKSTDNDQDESQNNFPCSIQDCGRVFKTKEEQSKHLQRRH